MRTLLVVIGAVLFVLAALVVLAVGLYVVRLRPVLARAGDEVVLEHGERFAAGIGSDLAVQASPGGDPAGVELEVGRATAQHGPFTLERRAAALERLRTLTLQELSVLLVFATGLLAALLWGTSTLVRAFRCDAKDAAGLRADLAVLEDRVQALERAADAAARPEQETSEVS
jgi:hypothetical protein